MDYKLIGLNLRRIREFKKISQSEAAELAGISRAAYRNIENNESIPKVSTLQAICNGLGVKLQELFVPVKTLEKVRFRALKKMNNRDYILTEISRWLEDFNDLEEMLNERIEYRFEELTHKLSTIPPGIERAKYAAKEARKVLNLTDREPIHDIVGLLESSGIKVYPIRIASDGFFGLSVAKDDGGPAIVVNVWERISVERWIFSAAHELGHLLLHLESFDVDQCDENQDDEFEADTFASYFLMPENAFTSEWKDTYGLPFVDRVLKVKRIFRVSYRTVLYRLSEREKKVWGKFQSLYKRKNGKTLGKMDEPHALAPNHFQKSMSEVLRADEPDCLSSSDFMEDRLSRLIRIALEQDQISLSRGAEILRLDLDEMRERVCSWGQMW
jgi:Zn-dependent peptidase ImmA (M78 family)/DNA-binding XRE family transcriptional regulator